MALLGGGGGWVTGAGSSQSLTGRHTYYARRREWTHTHSTTHVYICRVCWSAHTNATPTQAHGECMHYLSLHTHRPTGIRCAVHWSAFIYTHKLPLLPLVSHKVCELNICLMQRWRGGQPVWLWAESPSGLPQPSPLACVTGPAHAASPLPSLLSSPSSCCLPPGPGINRWVMPAVLPRGGCGGGAQKPCFSL